MQQSQHTGMVDEAIASTLYQRYAAPLFNYLRLHTVTREDAEDLLVDVFLAALENSLFAALPDQDQRKWLWRVAHNKVVDYHRRAKLRRVGPLDDVADTLFQDEALEPEQSALRLERYDALHRSIAQLPVLQREVLQLRFVYGMRSAEIAARLGKREGAVRMLLSRTLNLLRSIYERGQRDETP